LREGLNGAAAGLVKGPKGLTSLKGRGTPTAKYLRAERKIEWIDTIDAIDAIED
jgi:hypothetical protein